ncbi:MAG: hypothetical protein K5668_06165 [Lachnospiraceae bacterium]|nr:hypothetical protein [Lachnospiraceae bacterium]
MNSQRAFLPGMIYEGNGPGIGRPVFIICVYAESILLGLIYHYTYEKIRSLIAA